jgi:hypothetical protein
MADLQINSRKRIALVTVASAMVLAACGSSPAGPGAPPPIIYRNLGGVVVDQSGTCIKDATVTLIGGERHGEVAAQETPCSAQEDPEERDGGFVVNRLPLGEVVTLRGSAAGYGARDVNVLVRFPQDPLVIQLLKSD